MSLVKIDPKEYGLEEKRAVVIEQAFAPKILERDELAKTYEQVIKKELTPALCNEASTLRKQLVKVRTGIASIHTSQKSYFWAAGKFADAWKNKETLPITQMEETLSGIEKHFENIEKERIEKLQTDRFAELCKYDLDGEIIESNTDLGNMADEVWKNFLSGTKLNYDNVIAEEKKAEEAERQRIILEEKERIAKEKAERAERERINKENEQLKAEAIENERLAKIEQAKRDKVEAERIKKETIETAKREALELAKQKKHDAEVLKERLEKERLEQEITNKDLIEQNRLADEEIKRQADLNKGDSDKVNDLVKDLSALELKYKFKSKDNQRMFLYVVYLLNKIIAYINEEK